MTTKNTIANDAMRDIKNFSETNVIVINRDDLKSLITNAIESGIELGLEQAAKAAAKGKKPKVGLSTRTKSVPFDDEEDSILMDDEDEPDYGACTKGDPPGDFSGRDW